MTVDAREVPLAAVAADGLRLAGTLSLPAGSGPHPAVLLLPGSGPVDRDSDAPRFPLGLGRALAGALTGHGIATYRFDRRGVGETPGDWRAAGFGQNRGDAGAALGALRAHPGVRSEAVAVVGHSEGALHAAALAAREPVAAAVLLACAARPGEEVLLWQARSVQRDLPAPLRVVLRLLRTSVADQQARTLAAVRRTTTDVAVVRGARLNARWFREFLDHDPRPDLAAIRVPVLAVTGDKDVQVDPTDLERIAGLVRGEARTRLVPDLTHVLRRDDHPASLRRHRRLLREPVDADLLADTGSWLAAHLPGARP